VKPYYDQDGITIYHADCREMLPALSRVVSLSIADVPYGVVDRESGGLRELDKGDADVETFDVQWLTEQLIRCTCGSIYVWCGTEQVSGIRSQMVTAGLTTRLCVWEKTDPSPMNGEHFWLSALEACVFGRKAKAIFNEFCKSPRFTGPSERNIPDHPTPKPEWLMNRLICASSAPGDLVLDPCCGSGTTLVSAKLTGRRAIGIERNERYCEIAANRLAQGVLFGAGDKPKVVELVA
jgi:site-specific DNA-methyltransferase (adenine-specific)